MPAPTRAQQLRSIQSLAYDTAEKLGDVATTDMPPVVVEALSDVLAMLDDLLIRISTLIEGP
jgi:hypothetical protein